MRILVIIGAYLVSCLAAATVIMAATVFAFAPTDSPVAHVVGAAVLLTPFVAVFAALPAGAIIAYAEQYDRCSAFFFAAAGAAVAAICLGGINVGLFAAGLHGSGPKMDAANIVRLAGMLASYTFAGLVAGLTYWRIAIHSRSVS